MKNEDDYDDVSIDIYNGIIAKQSQNDNETIITTWSSSIEIALKIFGERSAASAKLHNLASRHYIKLSNRFSYSNIFLSVLAGTFGFSSSGTTTNYSFMFGFTIAAMNIISAFLSSLQKFLQSEQKSEKHNISSIEYSTLYRDISTELRLSRADRTDAMDFLKKCKNEYDRIYKKSPPVPKKIIDVYKRLYPNRVNNPEQCNGMSPITIHSLSDSNHASHSNEDFMKLKAFYKLRFNSVKKNNTQYHYEYPL